MCVPMDFEYRVVDNEVVITKINNPLPKISFPNEIEGMPVTKLEGPLVIRKQRNTVEEIYLPDSMQVLGEYAIYDFHYLKKLHINQGLKKIEKYGIYTCPDLHHIVIPSSVETIDELGVGYYYEHGRSYKQRFVKIEILEKTRI